jgi:CheY-like chemotaxis protein
MPPTEPPKPHVVPVPAHPEDPLDLDFSSLVEVTPEEPPPRATPEAEENALIGSRNLGEEGFHVVVARQRLVHAANRVVLVVDDDAATAELVAIHLRKAGYQAAVALNPFDAARHMTRLGPPALVILDVEMPGMSGIEFLERIRRNKHLRDLPVILFTAHSGREDIVRGLLAGADGYLAKPATSTALLSVVKMVLGE